MTTTTKNVACRARIKIKGARSQQESGICTHLSTTISKECPIFIQYLWTTCIEFNKNKVSVNLRCWFDPNKDRPE